MVKLMEKNLSTIVAGCFEFITTGEIYRYKKNIRCSSIHIAPNAISGGELGIAIRLFVFL